MPSPGLRLGFWVRDRAAVVLPTDGALPSGVYHSTQEGTPWQEGCSGCSMCGNCSAGFGMGLERFVAWMCKLDHLRETIPYPRMLYKIYP